MKFRKSHRKEGYDYSTEGHYFITICTHFKEHTLATIDEFAYTLSAFGRIVQSCWENIPKSFSTVRLDAFKIMPNHIHGIIELREFGKVALPQIIQNFKSVSTRKISVSRKIRQPVWQENYHDRIIRTERELNLIRLYISLNPVLWREHAELSEIDLTEEKMAEILDKFRSKS